MCDVLINLNPKIFDLIVIKFGLNISEIEVPKTATVAQLRNSVENAFSHLPKEGPGKVSW